MKAKLTFSRGVHPPDYKSLAAQPIVTMPAPKTVYIPLVQHMGKPAKAIVAPGQAVKAGTLLARADGQLSTNIHASVSGTVREIVTMPANPQPCLHIVIDNDGRMEQEYMPALAARTPDAILKRIEDAGIVGMGGAGFPSAVKLNPQSVVDTLLINGAECEPFITCDHRIMLELSERFLRGCRILADALSLKEVIVAVEDNKPDAILRLNETIAAQNIEGIRVLPLQSKYPQGAERQLIYAVTGRKVPSDGLPSDIGVLVHNVHTALSAYFAVEKGIPLYRRILTVSGDGVERPCNVLAPVGVTLNDVLVFAGGMTERETVVKMIAGGPMMGTALAGGGISVTKTTGCLLLLTDKLAETTPPGACINCARCAEVCPMRLMPMYIDKYTLTGDPKAAKRYGAMQCIECGCCAYACPAKRTLVQSIRRAKKEIRDGGV